MNNANFTVNPRKSQEGFHPGIHSLDPCVADVCGVCAAVILYQLPLLIDRDTADGGNFHDGRYWTRRSMNELHEVFHYLTENQIRTAIDKLEKRGYIVKGNYNRNRYDHTTWYAMTNTGRGLME